MNWQQSLGWLLGYENVRSIDRIDASFAAAWARSSAWVFFACAGLAALTFVFYLKYQTRGSTRVRMSLAVVRALLLSLLVLLLAEPVLTVTITSSPKPLLWIVFDGSDSMNLVDELPEDERQQLAEAVGLSETGSTAAQARLPRIDYAKALLSKDPNKLFEKLSEKYRLRPFIFDRPDGVRSLDATGSERTTFDGKLVADEWKAKSEVTAIGSALADLARRQATGNLAGIVLVSDFDQNAGPPPLEPAQRLEVPIYTVGVGPTTALDLAVELQAPLLMKKAEQTTLFATLRHAGLGGKAVTVKLESRRLGAGGGSEGETTLVGQRTVTLPDEGSMLPVDFPFLPQQTGRFMLVASVDRVEGEVVDQNNRSEREINVQDDFLRLFFVEYEPSWEWRFIKEVFHRDSLVGQRGFRTFLRSADPKVRHESELFVPTLTPQRSEFFASDVIFLGDMPSATLSTRFCEMAKEFVGTFGGGLVVLSGPRFGPGQLAGTPLADMLPVVVDPDARIRDDKEFVLKRTADSEQYDFMQLGSNEAENEKAWGNLGPLPWYQPVKRLHPSGSTALAVHPTDMCVDGMTPQPIIAVRRYGRGEVIYVGFNETWRLRAQYGELYYRKFWGQMIHRLGLSHALGAQKRFVVRSDRQQYQADDTVLLSVEAYDLNFEPLAEDKLPDRKLTGEILIPGRQADDDPIAKPLSIPQVKVGLFEARVPVFAPGEYRAKVTDPMTRETVEVDFRVQSVSAEGRSAVRNVHLQETLAATTKGKSYDLTTVHTLPADLTYQPKIETTPRVTPLWNTWLCFALVILFMFGEWVTRKLVNLP